MQEPGCVFGLVRQLGCALPGGTGGFVPTAGAGAVGHFIQLSSHVEVGFLGSGGQVPHPPLGGVLTRQGLGQGLVCSAAAVVGGDSVDGGTHQGVAQLHLAVDDPQQIGGFRDVEGFLSGV